MRRERGFALLIVLWSLGLLALLVGQFIAAGRTEAQIAANLRANAVTQAAADGALYESVLRLLKGTWAPDGRIRTVRVGDAAVEVRIRDQSWKVNPNTATAPVLQALLVSVGVDGNKAEGLARAIIETRSPPARPRPGAARPAQARAGAPSQAGTNQLFDSLDDVALAPGMTPAVFAKLRPYLSVYQEADSLTSSDALPASFAEPSRLVGDGWHLGSTGRVMLVMVEATAVGAHGGRFTRQAIIRLRAEASLDQNPFQILTWDTSAG
jgi:general secretion pathway protein K